MRCAGSCPSVQALHLLSFCRHVHLPDVAEADSAAAHQAKLAQYAPRTLAQPVGRGALTLNTMHLLPTEPLTAHKFCLHGARAAVPLLRSSGYQGWHPVPWLKLVNGAL